MLTRPCFGLLAAICASIVSAAWAAEPKPNIIFIMADDLGNADLGYRGGEIQTPNIDALAKKAVRLESFYGQQVCTPSRAALMSGRYPMRYGLQTLVIFPSHSYGLPTDERTLPQALKEAGYRTMMVGKWHLGHADQKYWPQNRGFDHFYGNVMGEVDYFTKERGGLIDWQRNGEFLREDAFALPTQSTAQETAAEPPTKAEAAAAKGSDLGTGLLSGPRWSAEPLTGDWFGARLWLADHGLTFGINVVNTVQGVLEGGRDDDWDNGGSVYLESQFSSERAGLWLGGFHDFRLERQYGDFVNREAGTAPAVNMLFFFPSPTMVRSSSAS
ncbi:MAG: sulfatase-like hydrolase/transferase [Defluviicoccus sp.]